MSEILHHGYPCPMSDEQITEALWKLGGYSPEGVAVQQTIAALRLALETATRELDEIRATGGTSLTRLDAAERERDEARTERDRAVTIATQEAVGHSRALSALSRSMTSDEADAVEEIEGAMFAAPPADAATEAVREAAEVVRKRLDNVVWALEYDEHAPGLVSDVEDLLRALSTPAPAPSAKEGRT